MNSLIPHYAIAFLGPNGSGKTSILKQVEEHGLQALNQIFPMPTYFINPDQFSKSLENSIPDKTDRDRAAFYQAMEVRRSAMQNKQTFAFESVASHSSRIAELIELKEQGYCLLIIFISTINPEINVKRVDFRASTGSTTGHYVDPEKVRSRYARSMNLAVKAVELADAAFIYDNSADNSKPLLQIMLDGEEFQIAHNAVEWATKLAETLRERADQFHELLAGFAEPEIANVIDGRYLGSIVRVTPYYLLMLTEQNKYIIHDRILLDADVTMPRHYVSTQTLLITYRRNTSPEVEGT